MSIVIASSGLRSDNRKLSSSSNSLSLSGWSSCIFIFLVLLLGSRQYTRRATYNDGMSQDYPHHDHDDEAADAAADARAAALAAAMADQHDPQEAATAAPHPYAALNPECVLDALDSIGLRGDGRLLALNSYENRVYQVGIEDDQPLVAKFYRPGRWTDEAILEEHGFTEELAAREIPVVPAMAVQGRTLHHFNGFRFAVFARHGGRAPELDAPEVLEWTGRFIARIHAVGAIQPYQHRPAAKPG